MSPSPTPKSSSTSTIWISAIALVLLAIFSAGAWFFYQPSPTNPALGAGVPLNQSSTQIRLLEESSGGLSLTGKISPSTHITPLATQETSPPPKAEAPVVGPTPTGIQLGATLSLLLQAYTTGGTGARNMANIAYKQAQKVGDPVLMQAIAQLRDGTPREGPITLTLLLLEAGKIQSLGIPDNLPETPTAEPESWLMKQVHKFVTIRRNGQTPTTWESALAQVQVHIARGNVADATILLEQAPLKADTRLNTLRSLTREYLGQYGKVVNALNTYLTRVLQAAE